MNFGNTNTGEIVDTLPTTLTLAGTTITGATLKHFLALGWRTVTQVDKPDAGYRVTSYGVAELTPTTCKLTVATSVNIADEAAAAAAAKLASDKDEGKTLAELSTSPTGRAIQALAAMALQEINTLRTKAGLSTYTGAQFISALKAKIDAQT